MTWDTPPYGEWGPGDSIIFSIRNTKPTGNWDGGEIVVKLFDVAGGSFLNHGGHLWNTAFTVAAKFGVDTEEIDAIEAFSGGPHSQTPTLTGWGLIILIALLIASTVFILLRRRKPVVPA